MTQRSIYNRIKNIILLMYLIRNTNQQFKLEDHVKMQKLTFLSQNQLIKKKMNGFAYNFFRWNQGPYSANLGNDIVLLRQINFLKWGNDKIELSERGKYVLENCKEILEENKNFLNVVDKIIKKYGSLSPEEIKEMVYKMKIMVPKIKKLMIIEEIPPGTPMLFGLSDRRAKNKFNVNEEWVDTLEILIDDEAIYLLKQAQKDAIEGNTVEFNSI